MDRTEGAKKRARFTAINHHLKIGLLGAQHTGREQSDLLVGSEVEGSGQGLSPERRLEQTMNSNCKLVKKNLTGLSAPLSGQLGREAMRAPGSSYRDVL
jgi:hypothetical protein